ncbi:PSD1 and planctomycete cytochrome C domain-containing protein [Singulisphaera sp. PoT]|uniref:PSD1 and planctomycete cytochrome C domain-containing protein n=1 Tax=Singulisphaera sp. PoT TaxID=3411797 RepID=UPI003BF4805D
MRDLTPTWSLTLVLLALSGQSSEAAKPVDYLRQVKPVLKERCLACHGALKQKAGLRLDTGEAIRRGGDGGPAAEPGNVDESLLIERIVEKTPAQRMPPEGAPLSAEQVATLRAWVEQGARSPEGETPEADPKQHWSFQKPERPAVPEASNSRPDWARNPIDEFIAREQARRGVTPLPAASPQVLLRRVYLDLTGLPPTRDELRQFLADPSEAAYAKVVDRLLDSPAHGERWARHWMDVWRYSDWYGRRSVPDVTNSYAQIWRWRDWIVRSLNEDKGYDRMVQEMLAADELAPADVDGFAATGFLVRNFYRWNYNSWMKDNVEHTAKAFLGLTVNCAHCHDHKYDPITQEDYFRLRACFEPLELRHERVAGEPDPGIFPKYDYGKNYPPITSGMVRIFDEKLDAQTFLYTRGESRNVVPGRPPIPAGAPAFLDRNATMRVEPINLPAEIYYPGLQPVRQREALDHETAAVATTGTALKGSAKALAVASKAWLSRLPKAQGDADWRTAWITFRADLAQAMNARSQRAAIAARIDADNVRYGRIPGDAAGLAKAASKAERLAAIIKATADLAVAGKAREVVSRKAKADPKAAPEVAAAEASRAKAKKDLEAASAALPKETDAYTSFGPAFPSQSTGRRLALARWITDRENPLAARVAANHIWRWHFGTPLVATTQDFGRNGKAPTHPELLDWLAVELMAPTTSNAPAWSMKALHRLIVMSSAYRLASASGPAPRENLAADPENQAYWKFPAARMEAEVVRDSMLQAAGELDPTVGGPDIDFAQGLASRRRSLYFTHHGEARMPFLELFDAADAGECYRRTTTVVPQQALALTNNEWLLGLSQKLSARLWDEAKSPEPSDRTREFIAHAFEQVLARGPSSLESDLSSGFLRRQVALLEQSGPAAEKAQAPAKARRDFIHALFSHNDFVTIR